MSEHYKTGAGEAAGERPAQGRDSQAPDSPGFRLSINTFGHRLKDLFQGKQWDRLREELGLSMLWYFDEPLTLSDAIARAESRLGRVRDLEVMLVRILKSNESDTKASGSYTCCLMWVEPDTWQQHEVDFDLHLAFRKDDDLWKVSYLGLTAATPDEVPFPEDEPRPIDGTWMPCRQMPDGDLVCVYVRAWVPRQAAQTLLDAGVARQFGERAQLEEERGAEDQEP